MHKQHSFQLPKVSPDSPRDKSPKLQSEQLAEDSLFEISRCEDGERGDSFWK